jgi:hypothetical protein
LSSRASEGPFFATRDLSWCCLRFKRSRSSRGAPLSLDIPPKDQPIPDCLIR